MNDKKGFTLIELMIALSIMVIIFIIGSEFIVKSFKSLTFTSEQDTAIQNARKIMEKVTKEIRECANSERGDYPISEIGDQTLTFYGDVDNDGSAERIHYFVQDSIFIKEATKAGTDKEYNSAISTSTIAEYVNNQSIPIFTYFDSNNATTTLINNVRMIKVKLRLNVTPWRAPDDYDLETNIELRNLKDNL